MKYTDIPLDNISLNLSKNQLQPSYWKDMNAYAFDSMVQPISKTDIGYKNNFVLGDDLYSIDGKKLYKNNKLLHDYTNDYLTKTTEYSGYKKGNYKLGTDDNFYYKDTALLSVDYDSSSLWVHSSKDYAILLTISRLYFFDGIEMTSMSIPEFEFKNCVQIDDTNSVWLVEKTTRNLSDDADSPEVVFYGCFKSGVKTVSPTITSQPIVRLVPTKDYDSTTIVNDGITHSIIASEYTAKPSATVGHFYAVPTKILRIEQYGSSSAYWPGTKIISVFGDKGPDHQDSYYGNDDWIDYDYNMLYASFYVEFPKYIDVYNNNITYTWERFTGDNPDDTTDNPEYNSSFKGDNIVVTTGYSANDSTIGTLLCEVYTWRNNNIIKDYEYMYGLQMSINTMRYKQRGGTPSPTAIVPASATTEIRLHLYLDKGLNTVANCSNKADKPISVINTSSKVTNGNWTVTLENDTPKCVLYNNKIVVIPYIIDNYNINGDTIQVFSKTINKTFEITISKDNDLKVINIGDIQLVTNSIYSTNIVNGRVTDNKFDILQFESKQQGWIPEAYGTYSGGYQTAFTEPNADLPNSIGSAYIATTSNDIFNGATEIYTYETPDKDTIVEGYTLTGDVDVYIGTTGTVAYSFTTLDGLVYVKDLEQEYGVSEEAQYAIPITDDIDIMLDYDIYSTFVKIQGYTIQLSVVDNEIQSTVTLASIEGDTQAIFTIQGQGYQIIKNSIYSFTSSGESGLENQQFITPCKFDYIGYDDTTAYFWDPLTKNIICFTGNNQMSTLQSMSLLNDITFSDYDVEHQMLVLSTTDKTYVKLYNNWMSFDFPTTTSALIYKDKLLLDNHQLILGEGDLDIQTGWIYNNNANQPLVNLESIFVTLLEKGNITVTVDFMSPDKNITTMSKTYSNVEYLKMTPTVLLCKAVRLHIISDVAVTGITIAVDDKTKESPISNKQYVEI